MTQVEMEELKPTIIKGHPYAIALCIEGVVLAPLNSYATIEDLRINYFSIADNYIQNGLSLPVPIQFNECTSQRSAKVLENVLREYKSTIG